MRETPHRIAISSLIGVACLLLCPADAVRAEESDAPRPAHFVLYEKERSLVFLPLHNDTGEGGLGYLSEGIPRVLAAELDGLAYMRVRRPRGLFVVTPRGESPGSGSLNENQRYARVDELTAAPTDVDRVILEVEARALDSEIYPVVQLDSAAEQARELSADYIVRGSYSIDQVAPNGLSRTSVQVDLELYDAVEGRSTRLAFEATPELIYRSLGPTVREIRSRVLGGAPVPIVVESTPAEAMVFLDELYLGRTPVRREVLPGRYRLRLAGEGFVPIERDVEIDSSGETRLAFNIDSVERRAGLHVTSQPEGARVYLNLEMIGTTPLSRSDLPPGTHRLRIVHEGHIDRIVGVRLKNGEMRNLELKMDAGDTQTHYLDPGYVIFDYTYGDLSFYSLITALGFYGGYIGLDVQANRVSDSVRSQAPLVGFLLNPSQLNVAPVALLYQYNLLESNARQVERLRDGSRAMAGGGFLSLIAAGYFLYEMLAFNAAKEVGEIDHEQARAFVRPGPRTIHDPDKGALASQSMLVGVEWTF